VVSLVAAALARAQAFLLEPAPASARTRRSPPEAAEGAFADLQVAVIGLTPECGSSTVARGLAVALGVPGCRSAQLISVTADGTRDENGRLAGKVFAGGSGPVATVWDIAASEVERASQVAVESDAVFLVAGDHSAPALAQLVSGMLSERFGRVLLVATRVADRARWSGRAIACVPDSRLGAALLARGRRPVGELAGVLTELAAIADEAAR